MENKEEWRDIPGYEGIYQVSNIARIRTLLTPIKLRHKGNMLSTDSECSIRNGKGYKFVTLYKTGQKKQIMVHRLVALTFIPNPAGLPQVNHKDTDKHNNSVSNLEWCTNRFNKDHAIINGLSGKGEKNAMAKLTDDDVLKLRELYKSGVTPRELCIQFGISKKYIHTVVKRKSWKHI